MTTKRAATLIAWWAHGWPEGEGIAVCLVGPAADGSVCGMRAETDRPGVEPVLVTGPMCPLPICGACLAEGARAIEERAVLLERERVSVARLQEVLAEAEALKGAAAEEKARAGQLAAALGAARVERDQAIGDAARAQDGLPVLLDKVAELQRALAQEREQAQPVRARLMSEQRRVIELRAQLASLGVSRGS
jgi:hypothetical protein